MLKAIFNQDRWISFLFRKISSQLFEDWCLHWRDWSTPGFRAVAVYRFGAWLRSDEASRTQKRMLGWAYRILYRYVRNHYGIDLPATTIVGRRLCIAHHGGIVIHHNAVIGDDCVILQGCTIGAASIKRYWEAPRLGNRVKLGAGAVIAGKVTIGDDVSIGPNVSVLMNIPSGAVVSPQPPRVFKLQTQERLRAWDIITRPTPLHTESKHERLH